MTTFDILAREGRGTDAKGRPGIEASFTCGKDRDQRQYAINDGVLTVENHHVDHVLRHFGPRAVQRAGEALTKGADALRTEKLGGAPKVKGKKAKGADAPK
jgi:hypothetical protein